MIVSAPVTVSIPTTVNTPAGPLKVNAAIVLPFVVRVAVPISTIVAVKFVNVPVDDNVRSPAIFNEVAANVNPVVPKSRLLYQLAVVNVGIEAPVVNVRFGAVIVEPPDVLPTLNVLVLAISATVNPPVPVQVKPPNAAMFNTTVAAVVCVRLILAKYGLVVEDVAVPTLVIVLLYVELSFKKVDPYTVFNNKLVCVPVIAVEGLPFVLAV